MSSHGKSEANIHPGRISFDGSVQKAIDAGKIHDLIELFSNLGDASADEITRAPFRDPILSRWLIEQGYFHFARLTSDNYDPVCLSIQPKTLAVERFDHEAILQEQATVHRLQVAETFLELLERVSLDR